MRERGVIQTFEIERADYSYPPVEDEERMGRGEVWRETKKRTG